MERRFDVAKQNVNYTQAAGQILPQGTSLSDRPMNAAESTIARLERLTVHTEQLRDRCNTQLSAVVAPTGPETPPKEMAESHGHMPQLFAQQNDYLGRIEALMRDISRMLDRVEL